MKGNKSNAIMKPVASVRIIGIAVTFSRPYGRRLVNSHILHNANLPCGMSFRRSGKVDHLGTPSTARAFTVCNQGDIGPSDQMIVYVPATDTGPSGELIGRITFQNSLAVSNELLLPCRPAVNVRYLTDPY